MARTHNDRLIEAWHKGDDDRRANKPCVPPKDKRLRRAYLNGYGVGYKKREA